MSIHILLGESAVTRIAVASTLGVGVLVAAPIATAIWVSHRG